MLKFWLLKNEDGYLAIVTALLILTLLTLIGISASRVAFTEAAMARNEVIYKRNFYLAEGAALEAADHLTRYGNLRDNSKPWMEMITGNLDVDSLRFYWDNSIAAGDTVIPQPSKVNPDHTLFLIGHDGIGEGSSLDMSKSSIHSIAIYGRCDWDGTSIIKMGYQAAY
jgi:hypothetical protein